MCSVANLNPVIFTITLSGAGSCTITARQAGDANYAAAPDVTQTFAIGKSSQTIYAAAAPAQSTCRN